jgi:hypothetical protein
MLWYTCTVCHNFLIGKGENTCVLYVPWYSSTVHVYITYVHVYVRTYHMVLTMLCHNLYVRTYTCTYLFQSESCDILGNIISTYVLLAS